MAVDRLTAVLGPGLGADLQSDSSNVEHQWRYLHAVEAGLIENDHFVLPPASEKEEVVRKGGRGKGARACVNQVYQRTPKRKNTEAEYERSSWLLTQSDSLSTYAFEYVCLANNERQYKTACLSWRGPAPADGEFFKSAALGATIHTDLNNSLVSQWVSSRFDSVVFKPVCLTDWLSLLLSERACLSGRACPFALCEITTNSGHSARNTRQWLHETVATQLR